MSHILNLHLPNAATPHTFDAEPNSILVAVRVATPDAEVDISVQSFFRLSALSADLRRLVVAEILATVPSAATAPLELTPERPTVGDDVRVDRVEPKTVLHGDLDSFVAALAECRAGDGTLLPCDDPRSRRIGFVHHPKDGESVVHEIGLRAVKGTTLSDGVATRIGLEPHEVPVLLATYDGRHFLVTGQPVEPDPTPEQDDLLQAVMMAAPLRVDVQSDGDGEVDFPDVDLFRGAELIEPAPRTLSGHRARPAWMPDGWAVLKFPEDGDRAAVLDDPSPVGATGAFARRGDHLFRAFDDGRWDESKWHPPVDADGGRYVPGGYRVHRSGYVGRADIETALDAVLPAYHATAPAVVRGGAP